MAAVLHAKSARYIKNTIGEDYWIGGFKTNVSKSLIIFLNNLLIGLILKLQITVLGSVSLQQVIVQKAYCTIREYNKQNSVTML